MNKNPLILSERRKYLQEGVNNRPKDQNIDQFVKAKAKELFLSESIILKDLKKDIKK